MRKANVKPRVRNGRAVAKNVSRRIVVNRCTFDGPARKANTERLDPQRLPATPEERSDMLRNALSGALSCLVCLSGLSLAQDTRKAPTRTSPIDTLQQRQRLLSLENKLREAIALQADRRDERLNVLETAENAKRARASDDKLRGYQKAMDLAGELLKERRNDRARTEDLLSRIRQAGQGQDMADRLKRKLIGWEAIGKKLLAEQSKDVRGLAKLGETLMANSKRVAPPAAFQTADGMDMVLVGQGAKAFYVSKEPVGGSLFAAFRQSLPASDRDKEMLPAAGGGSGAVSVPWSTAARFCRWMQARLKAPCRLPTVNELELACPNSEQALWSESEWKGPNASADSARQRFGVKMMSIWDPAGSLGTGQVFGEVLFARYPGLGFRVVTSQMTGKIERWNRLKKD